MTRLQETDDAQTPAQLIDEKIAAMDDWRGRTLARMRELIKQADPDVIEDVKWRKPTNAMSGVPVWEHAGIICTGEAYRRHVKLTFMRGAAIPDPSCVFNGSLEGGTRRAIDIAEGDEVDEDAFREIIRAAVVLNLAKLHR